MVAPNVRDGIALQYLFDRVNQMLQRKFRGTTEWSLSSP
jgi:hypothetical protein